MVVSTVSQVVILLYLMDGMGLVIECWKITKAVNVSLIWNKKIEGEIQRV